MEEKEMVIELLRQILINNMGSKVTNELATGVMAVFVEEYNKIQNAEKAETFGE